MVLLQDEFAGPQVPPYVRVCDVAACHDEEPHGENHHEETSCLEEVPQPVPDHTPLGASPGLSVLIHAPPTRSLANRVRRTNQSLAQLPLSLFQNFIEPLDDLNQFVGIGLFAGLFTKLTPLRIGHSFLQEREEAIRSPEHNLFSIEQ
jgi:hypothetical protein